MTLVLTAATQQYLVQVSDRRTVRINASDVVTWSDDEVNKAVWFRGRTIFAFSGLADLGIDNRTDMWLARTLAELENQARADSTRDAEWLFKTLAERCTAEFAIERNARLSDSAKRHSFVAAGFATYQGNDLQPFVVRITNASDQQGRPLREPTAKFEAYWELLGTMQNTLLFDGYAFTQDERDAFMRQVAAVAAAYPGPIAVITALGDKIREIADHDDTVGCGLMISVIPRKAAELDPRMTQFYSSGPPLPNRATFHYVPSDAQIPGQPQGPILVSGGGVFEIGVGPAPWRRQSSSDPGPDL